jgi:hypothetical protein
LNSRLDIEKKDLGNLRRDFKKYPNWSTERKKEWEKTEKGTKGMRHSNKYPIYMRLESQKEKEIWMNEKVEFEKIVLKDFESFYCIFLFCFCVYNF